MEVSLELLQLESSQHSDKTSLFWIWVFTLQYKQNYNVNDSDLTAINQSTDLVFQLIYSNNGSQTGFKPEGERTHK